MTASRFFAELTSRAPAFRDRFRELHLDKGRSATPALTTVQPRNPQGFWTRLKAMGPIGLARSSYQGARSARAETIGAYKEQLATQFGKRIADRVAVRLDGSSKLTLSRARQIYSDAARARETHTLNLKKIAFAVSSSLEQRPVLHRI